MGIVFRQSVKATITTMTGALLGALIVYLQPVYFSKIEFGFSRYLVNWGALVQYIVLLGMHNTIVTFLPRYGDKEERRKVLLGVSFMVPVLACAVLSIPYFLLKHLVVQQFKPQDIPYISRYYAALPVMVLIWSFMTLADAYLITRVKIAVSSFIRDVVLRIGNIGLIFLFAVGWITFDAFVIATVLIYLLPMLALILISKKTEGFGWSFRLSLFSKIEWKEIRRYAQYHLLAGLALNLVGYIDALMLPALDRDGLKSLAAYSVAIFIAGMLPLVYKAMSSAAFPSINDAYIAKDDKKLADLFRRSAINILIVGTCMAMLILCNLRVLVSFLPLSYNAVLPLSAILIIGRMADVVTGMNSEVISISGYYKFFFRLSLGLLILLVIFCRVLIPRFGMYGAAWGSTLALTIFNVAKTIFLWLRFRLHPFTKGTLAVLAAGCVAGLLGYYLPLTGFRILDLALKSTAAGATYFMLLLWLKPSPDLQQYVMSVRRNKRFF